MKQFNFPTIIFFGDGSLEALAKRIAESRLKRIFLVTDATLVKIGIVDSVLKCFAAEKIAVSVFSETHPNPLEEDVEKGLLFYLSQHCDAIVALGGGSPIDLAKVIRFRVSHGGPLAQYDDAIGGDKLIQNPMPALFAIPTTSGTGSEVGRSGVIIMRDTGKKTIFFHPKLIPDIAVLEPTLTAGLPAHITAATGIDAFTHCLEAYFAASFHPMADGIALEGIRLILQALPKAYSNGNDLVARGQMQIAAAMGATAFQKGLGMIHSLAHPLSARYNMHHGLANALLLPAAIRHLESSPLNRDARERIKLIQGIFNAVGLEKPLLSDSCSSFFQTLGIQFGLKQAGVPEKDLELLSQDAIDDSCHATNMIPITRQDMLITYQNAF